jgi:hypothetical protein
MKIWRNAKISSISESEENVAWRKPANESYQSENSEKYQLAK